MDYLSLAEAARRLGRHRVTLWHWAQRHPGFAVVIGGHHFVLLQHVQRLQAGESPAQIAARPSVTPIGGVAA